MDLQTKPSSPELNLDNLKALKVLGQGAMGTVFLVHDREHCMYVSAVQEKEINFLFCIIKVKRVEWRDFENFQGHFCTFDLNEHVY